MRGCLHFMAGVAALFFVVSAAIALFAVNLVQVIADREAIKEMISGLDELIVDVAPVLIAEAVSEEAQRQGLPPIDLDQELMSAAVEELLPPDWIDEQAAALVDTVYDFLETGTIEEATVAIELGPLITRFQGESGREVIMLVADSLPDCPESGVEVTLDPQNPEIPDCLPAELDREQIVTDMHRMMVQMIAQNPELVAEAGQVTVPLFTGGAEQGLTATERAELLQMQQNFQRVSRWAWTLWLLPAGSLLLVLVLAVRSLQGWGHWWGWPLLVTAVIVLVIAIVTPATLSLFLRNMIVSGNFQELAGPLREYTQTFLDRLTQLWLNRIYLQAGIMLLFGIGFVIMGVLAGMLRRVESPPRYY